MRYLEALEIVWVATLQYYREKANSSHNEYPLGDVGGKNTHFQFNSCGKHEENNKKVISLSTLVDVDV